MANFGPFFLCASMVLGWGYWSVGSTDGRYVLSLATKADDRSEGEYRLLTEGKLIWSDDCRLRGADEELVAAWARDSHHVIIAYPDGSLRALVLAQPSVASTAVDESALQSLAGKWVPYRWEASGQGSIPHFAILGLEAYGSKAVAGIYERGKFPNKVYIPFLMEFGMGTNLKLSPGSPVLKKWTEAAPRIQDFVVGGLFPLSRYP